jgi:phosphoglycolate phosphatase-like HAD superfamily hydrolase
MISRLFIFDIDGTLMSCGGSGRKAMNRAFYEMFQIENGFESVNMAGRLDKAILRESLEINRVALEDEAVFFSLYGHHLKVTLENTPEVFVLPGVNELLSAISSQTEILCALGTGNCEIGAYEKLRRVGLHERFVLGGYGDHHDNRTQLIRHVIEQAEIRFGYHHTRETTVVIGDTPLDVESGKAADATTVAVATGNYSQELLKTYGPDILLRDMTDSQAFLLRTDSIVP